METKYESFKELIEQSQSERRGLTVYTNGQTIVGIVVKVNGTETVELSSQMFRQIVIRIEAIDALALG